MDELERYRRRQAVRWKALRRLGVRNVRCVCGETDPIAFQADHLDRRKHSEVVFGICISCHAKITARQMSEHPLVGLYPGNRLAAIGHGLLGESDYLEFIALRHRDMAAVMFKLAEMGIDFEG